MLTEGVVAQVEILESLSMAATWLSSVAGTKRSDNSNNKNEKLQPINAAQLTPAKQLILFPYILNTLPPISQCCDTDSKKRHRIGCLIHNSHWSNALMLMRCRSIASHHMRELQIRQYYYIITLTALSKKAWIVIKKAAPERSLFGQPKRQLLR